jgi:3-oxoacyl-[acyl-carrier-protein] synthase II
LQALSTRNDHPETSLRPFNRDRDGFVMGEGAGALVLESVARARARGAPILGLVEGGGEAADCCHRTRSSPDGKPIIDCMRRAIADAGLSADDIDYINAHGTGTPENDKMEWLSIAAVFGDRASLVPVSSNKSMIGHTLSAAGIVEGVFTLLSLRDGLLPPTIGYETPDPAIPIDCVPNTARRVAIGHALSNSFGFGGQNVSIVFGAA